MRQLIKVVGSIIGPVLLSGCVAGSLFVPYPEQVRPALRAVDAGAAPPAIETKVSSYGPNELLTHLEQGRLAQIAALDDISKAEFDQAIALLNARDEEARIRVSGAASQGAAVAINDNATRYDGEFYERVFLHSFQALNYAMKGDLDGAVVEARRANTQQKAALEAFEKEVIEAKEKAREIPQNGDSGIQAAFSTMDARIGRVKYSFQVGYAFFVSALMYEARKEYNDAYIDYKKAYELAPSNSAVLKPLVRLSKQLGFADEYPKWKKLAGEVAPVSAQQGEVVVLYEEGFVPAKREISLPFFYSPDKIISLAFPIYQNFWESSAALQFNNTKTDSITETQILAAKALAEKRLQMITRQVLRAYAKGELQNAGKQRNGELGAIVAQLYSVISERADLRSWLSLPANTQVGRFTSDAGTHPLHLTSAGISTDLNVEVKPGHITLVRVIDTGSRFYARARVL